MMNGVIGRRCEGAHGRASTGCYRRLVLAMGDRVVLDRAAFGALLAVLVDDGGGLAVARVLAARGLPVRETADASVLLALLEAGFRVVVIDAIAGASPPGIVLQLDAAALAPGTSLLSSHGIGVAEAIALARTLYGEPALERLAIVGVAIDRPATHAIGLSPAVAEAIGPAAALAAALATGG